MDSILQTADRALQILELLSHEGLTSKDIQEKMNLNKSTVHRLMMTLLNRGFVERNEVTGIFQVGLKLVEISSIRLNHVELKTEALPYLHQLGNKVNKSIQLAILDGNEAVFIEKVEKYQSFHMYCQTGKRIPLYCSAVGKSLILNHSDNEIQGLLKDTKFEHFTPKTVTDIEALFADLDQARKDGYTRDHAEHEADVYCVAMPIYDYRGKIVAAASITGFSDKIYGPEGQEMRDALKITCDAISKRIGHQD